MEHPPQLIVLYWPDHSYRTALSATSPQAELKHSVFTPRSPDRPNPIEIGNVDLIHREGNRMIVRELDAPVGTPVLDIKPYLSGLYVSRNEQPCFFNRHLHIFIACKG